MLKRALLLSLGLSGCAAMSDNATDLRRRDTTFSQDIGAKPAEAQACRVFVVNEVPPGMLRVGSIRVPASLAREARIDELSREYACGLKATHAIKEEETTSKKGNPVWRMGIYR